ncbi:hypothetical protein ElyMa_004467100 [Elysia marginata]|uniref:Uncharacterized protein n=1 Tax=Elysia marginata TaxID=1093978 RepID=A0AAV4HHB1_9GAST|nr:hypothetical protein ElyMa_004467100 [Elysia marginata]
MKQWRAPCGRDDYIQGFHHKPREVTRTTQESRADQELKSRVFTLSYSSSRAAATIVVVVVVAATILDVAVIVAAAAVEIAAAAAAAAAAVVVVVVVLKWQ